MSYPIHITNIYELLNEDGEPTQVKVNAPSSATAQNSKTSVSQRSTNVGANNQQSKTTGQTSSSTRGAPSGSRTGNQSSRGGEERGPLGERKNTDRQNTNYRGGRGGDRPPRQQGERPPRQQGQGFATGEEVQRSFGNGERRDRERDGQSRGGESRARGAPAGGFVGNRRVFDRKSGTGRGKEYKKGGSGRGNWGRDGEGSEQVIAEDVAAVQEEGEGVTATKEDKPEEPEKEKVETEEEKADREEREKEAKLMTLADFMKQREQKTPVVALPTERKANEGVDQNEMKKWSNYQEIKRDGEQQSSDDANAETSAKKKKEKTLVQTFFTVKDTQPRDDRDRRGDRGDRGDRPPRGGDRARGGRGGSSRGGRGGSRGGRGGKTGDIPQFDENSFPTLATK